MSAFDWIAATLCVALLVDLFRALLFPERR